MSSLSASYTRRWRSRPTRPAAGCRSSWPVRISLRSTVTTLGAWPAWREPRASRSPPPRQAGAAGCHNPAPWAHASPGSPPALGGLVAAAPFCCVCSPLLSRLVRSHRNNQPVSALGPEWHQCLLADPPGFRQDVLRSCAYRRPCYVCYTAMQHQMSCNAADPVSIGTGFQ